MRRSERRDSSGGSVVRRRAVREDAGIMRALSFEDEDRDGDGVEGEGGRKAERRVSV